MFATLSKTRLGKRSPHKRCQRHLGLESLETRQMMSVTPQAIISATPTETYMLEMVNRLRANPAQELSIIKADPDVSYWLKAYGVNMSVLQQQWNSLKATTPLAWNDALCSAATAHTNLMLQKGVFDHVLPGEDNIPTRDAKAGYTGFAGAENIAYGPSPMEIHGGLAIDYGSGPKYDANGLLIGLGHRNNLMNPQFKEIGIGAVNQTANGIGPWVVTEDFGQPNGNMVFLTGVAYNDLNGNNKYDLAEALPGVCFSATNMQTGEQYYTTTGGGGGYRLAVPPGQYMVQTVARYQKGAYCQGGWGTNKVIQLGTDNVKYDFSMHEAGVTAMLPPGLPSPANVGSIAAWHSEANAPPPQGGSAPAPPKGSVPQPRSPSPAELERAALPALTTQTRTAKPSATPVAKLVDLVYLRSNT